MWDMTMTMISIRHLGACAAAAGLCCIVMTGTPAIAQQNMTAQTLIDRQLILDQITRYYYNFGRETKVPESSFYAEDGALILGTGAGRSLAAAAVKLGGLALIGGLAYRAYQSYQQGRPVLSPDRPAMPQALMPAPEGSGFETGAMSHDAARRCIRAMIAAAAA